MPQWRTCQESETATASVRTPTNMDSDNHATSGQRLSGKVALVTGGAVSTIDWNSLEQNASQASPAHDDIPPNHYSRTSLQMGFGYAMTKRFVAEGAKVVVMDLDGQDVEGTLGVDRVCVVAGDVTKRETWERALEAAKSRFGALHILVVSESCLPRKSRHGDLLAGAD